MSVTRAMSILYTAMLALATLSALPAATSADDTGACGVTLVLRNPDLTPDEQGFFHASGWFFIQFQAIGEGAENVDYFTFSFGKPAPNDYSNCDTPEWITGAYLKDYRGDYNAEDGFFVPINTTLVPDGEYGAAVHAYDANDNEVGRFWVKAIVDNCDGDGRCGDDAAQVVAHDEVMPWPIVLPGDGKQTRDVNGITIEFAEALQSVEASINGEPIELTPWEGKAYDDDATPGNDGEGGPTDITCTSDAHPGCTKRVWGPAFKWEGEIAENDVIKVRAVDLAGNTATKILHLLDPNAGGIIPGATVNLDVQVDESIKQTSRGIPEDFHFTLVNAGGADAHVNLFAEPDNRDVTRASWSPNHVVVPPGERAQAKLTVSPDASVDNGDMHVTARFEYQSGAEIIEETLVTTLVVGEGGELPAEPVGNQTGNATGLEDGGDSPALGAFAVTLGVLAAAVAFGRRRSD